MNPLQMLTNQLQMQIKANNPKMFQQIQEMMKDNPQDILNKIMSNYTPNQTEQFRQFANSFGVTDEQLNQYGISTKSVDIK